MPHAVLDLESLWTLSNAFALLSGVCWLSVYVVAIREGIRRRSYLIPMEALALNIVWEFIFGFIWSPVDPLLSGQAWVNLFWCLLDIGVVYTVWQWARIPNVSRDVLLAYFFGLLICAGGVLGSAYWVASVGPGPELGVIEVQAVSSFLMNVLMSCLFIRMYWAEDGFSSRTVAWLKGTGTLAVTLTYFLSVGADTHYYPIIQVCGALCFCLDGFYLWLLYSEDR
jgi:hypothetical protein